MNQKELIKRLNGALTDIKVHNSTILAMERCGILTPYRDANRRNPEYDETHLNRAVVALSAKKELGGNAVGWHIVNRAMAAGRLREKK